MTGFVCMLRRVACVLLVAVVVSTSADRMGDCLKCLNNASKQWIVDPKCVPRCTDRWNRTSDPRPNATLWRSVVTDKNDCESKSLYCKYISSSSSLICYSREAALMSSFFHHTFFFSQVNSSAP